MNVSYQSPASETAEESGCCYLESVEGENLHNLMDDDDDSYDDEPMFYRLMINDETMNEYRRKSPGLRQNMCRQNSKFCLV